MSGRRKRTSASMSADQPDSPSVSNGLTRRVGSKRASKMYASAETIDGVQVDSTKQEVRDVPTALERPVHAPKASLFSSSSGYTNYRGFLNLCILLLVLSNARVAIENVLKYGILVDPFQWVTMFLMDPWNSPVALLAAAALFFIYFALVIERRIANGRFTERGGYVAQVLNLSVVLIGPAGIVLILRPNPLAANMCLTLYTVVFLKLVSYVQVNGWHRRARADAKAGRPPTNHRSRQQQKKVANGMAVDGEGGKQTPLEERPRSRERSLDLTAPVVAYPENLNVADLAYFMCVPTLCYELNYPRTRRVHKWFLLKRVGEFLFLTQLTFALIQQWIVPLLRNSVQPFVQMDYGHMLERLLKLAIPNHLIWLISFYWLFHSFLNAMAEVTRFADREFYLDWWNAESVQYFWQAWNIPVHRWCVRHLYKPSVRAGLSRFQAATIVFLVSAFFHEYIVSVPLCMFRTWAFMGMLAQMPLNILTSFVLKGRYGNMAVWLTLIVGQPLAILMYLHDYYVMHYVTASGVAVNQTRSA